MVSKEAINKTDEARAAYVELLNEAISALDTLRGELLDLEEPNDQLYRLGDDPEAQDAYLEEVVRPCLYKLRLMLDQAAPLAGALSSSIEAGAGVLMLLLPADWRPPDRSPVDIGFDPSAPNPSDPS